MYQVYPRLDLVSVEQLIYCGAQAYKYLGSRCALLYLSHDQSASTHNSTGITTALKNILVIL